MKPTQSILILLSLFLIISCEEDTQTNEDSDDMMSLDWVLLKIGINNQYTIESCTGYEDWGCSISSNPNQSHCGGYEFNTRTSQSVDNCNGYDKWWECNCYKEGEVDNIVWVESCDGYNNCLCESHDFFIYKYYLWWNRDLNVCSSYGCDEQDLNDYDIVIPSHIPFSVREEGCDCVDNPFTFHPNCYNPLDTTMVLNGKNVSIEKMGGISRDYDGDHDTGGSSGYIHYYPLDNYLILTGESIDLNTYTIVDFQRKE